MYHRRGGVGKSVEQPRTKKGASHNHVEPTIAGVLKSTGGNLPAGRSVNIPLRCHSSLNRLRLIIGHSG